MAFKILILLAVLGLGSPVLAANLPQAGNVYSSGGPTNGSQTSSMPFSKTNLDTVRTLVATIPAAYTPDYYVMLAAYSASSSGVAIATGQYRVSTTAGVALYCKGFWFTANIANPSTFLQFGYGTAALGSAFTITAPAGSVPYGGASTSLLGGIFATNTTALIPIYHPYFVTFPSSSYPYVRSSVSGATAIQSITMDCVEL